jgi:hypothetical protein
VTGTYAEEEGQRTEPASGFLPNYYHRKTNQSVVLIVKCYDFGGDDVP